jgi:hypothetical protein
MRGALVVAILATTPFKSLALIDASAQSPPSEAASAEAMPRCCTIPAGTPVEIELTQLVSSKAAKPGDHFSLKLARNLVYNGVIVMANGAQGQGEVVDAAPAGLAGRPGKLILAARWVELASVHLPLHSFKLSGSGRDDSKTAIALLALPYAGILAVGIHGGNIDYPAGTRALAKVAVDTFIAASPTSVSPPTTPNPPTPALPAQDQPR